ncbi:MAG: TonB-dependent receptor [Acidobacteria bacterium]|nr:TonB-dependent receptor [Acidobacteriota bacterium]MBW4044545.1 TonB-dependent receptor [Acidobacteriota bacterium]
MWNRSSAICIWLCAVLVVALPVTSFAQVANNTSLVGTVLDPSGNPVSGANVKAVNVGTKVNYSGKTNDQGYYAITFIPAGTYNITVESQGFKSETSTGIPVAINAAVRSNFTLSIGSVQDQVLVTASTPPLATDDATVQETVNTRAIQDLPLSGRRTMDLAATKSDVIVGPKTSFTGIPPGEDFIGAGQREITNSLSLDGITIMNNLISTSAVTVSPDAIQEVQTQTGNYTAQYGAYMGVHINMVSKTGTNSLHGTAYDYVQNDAFDAKNFFNRSKTKLPLRYNQFGFELDGPVYFPKIYDGRDKTFFTAAYEGLRNNNQTGVGLGNTFTQAMRNGDFSQTSAKLFNPYTGTAFANNQIDPGLVSPIAQKIISLYYPLPNATGANNFTAPLPSVVNINNVLARVDQTFGQNVRLFVRYDWQNLTALGSSVTPTGATYGPTNNRNIAFGYTQVITPNFINDFRFGRNHLISNALNYWYQNHLLNAGTSLGIPGFAADTQFNNPGIPYMTVTNYLSMGNNGTNWFQDDTTWHGYDQVSWTHGKHAIMAGAELRKMTTGRAAQNNPLGIFAFNGQLTCQVQGGACASGTGNAAADFLLGLPQNDATPIQELKGVVTEWRDGFFILDNWQVNERLTLNYGIRYELPTVPYSQNGFATILNAQQTALIPANAPQAGFHFIDANHQDWAPRVGFAYRATNHVVIRGGGGIFYNPNQTNSFTLATGNPPFAQSTTYSTVPGSPALSFANPTPGTNQSKTIVPGTPGTYVSVFSVNPYLPTPTMYQWNLDAGNDLWKNAAFELQYLGSHSLHLDRSFYNNTPLPAPGNVNARRPNQLWGSIRQIQNDEFANYNGLTAIFRQRMTNGVQAMVSYTWAHDLDVSTDSNGGGAPMNPYNFRADYGNANWDIRHRLVASIIWELPKLSNVSPTVRTALGNWQLNTITTLQSGMPFNVTISPDQANTGVGNQRPNYVHAPSAKCNADSVVSGASCIDSSAYTLPASYTYGNEHRNVLYGPAYLDSDVSLFKNFPVYKTMTLQLRAEAFNVFNRAQLANPSATFQTSSFGTIQNTAAVLAPNRVLQFAGKINF